MRTRGHSAVIASVLCGCGAVWACSLQSPSSDELFSNSVAGSAGSSGSAGSAGSGGADGSAGGGGTAGENDGGGDADAADVPFDPQDGLILYYKFDQTSGP